MHEISLGDRDGLKSISNAVAKAKRIIVVTGAGISTNCGIPDFRSKEGLYSNTSVRPPALVLPQGHLKTKDLFDSSIVWHDEVNTSEFRRFMAGLRDTIGRDIKHVSATHKFIRLLRDQNRLLRCYTQNIDGLEGRTGLSTDLSMGKGSRFRFVNSANKRPRTIPAVVERGCEAVPLHGTLKTVRCTLCGNIFPWTQQHNDVFKLGSSMPCHTCTIVSEDRRYRGKRATSVGQLRPNVVLYGEEHPEADAIGSIAEADIASKPDLLIVMGTSLHVHGVKNLTREFSRSIKSRRKPDALAANSSNDPRTIYINHTRLSQSAWKDVFDVSVQMDCDQWVSAMKDLRPDAFKIQHQLQLTTQKQIAPSIQSLPTKIFDALSDDKENAATPSQKGLCARQRPLKTTDRSTTARRQLNTLKSSRIVPQMRCTSKRHLTPTSDASPAAKKRKSDDNEQSTIGHFTLGAAVS